MKRPLRPKTSTVMPVVTSKENAWRTGVLSENFGPLKKGDTVFYRKVSTVMAAGICWWLKPQGISHFWMVAESYGGEYLRHLVYPRSKGGQPLTSPEEKTLLLNSMLRSFLSSIHKEARPRWS